MKKKILLISTCFEDVVEGNVSGKINMEDIEKTTYPAGLIYLTSYLKSKDIEAKALYLNYVQIEEGINQIEKEIKKFSPDMVGIQLLSATRVSSYKAIEYIHKKYPEIQIVLGGIHSTIMYRQLIKKYPFLIIVLGEGEITLEELIKSKNGLKEIDGIAFWDNELNDVGRTKPREVINDLDRLPFPDHKLFFQGNRTSACLLTSRGCPFSCIEENQQVMFSRKPTNKIKTAKVGDKLMALNEKAHQLEETEVINIKVQEEEIFEIELENGKKIKATKDHLFYTKRGWVELQKLNENDQVFFVNFREKISFNKKVNNPMKRKDVVKKMIQTTRKRGWYKKSSERMRNLHNQGKMPTNTEKQRIAKHKSKNVREKNGMYNPNCKFRNYYDLKKKIKNGEIIFCELCKSQRNILVHHKDFNHDNDDLENLQIVCKFCHSKIHKAEAKSR